MAVKTAPYQAKDYSKLIGMSGFSEKLLTNHFTLYQGYVANTNKLLDLIAEAPKDGKNPQFAELMRRLGFEWNGMRLHEYYFDALGGGSLNKAGTLANKLSDDFGSVEEWEKSFKAVAGMRGIGWAALYFDPSAGRCLNFWIDEHEVSHPSGCRLLLIADVFEHAFMLDYGLNRADYIEALFRNINWEVVENRLREVAKS